MKRLLLIFSCVLCALVTWADKTCTISYNGSDVQSTAGYFTHSGNHNFNTKFKDATYAGISFTSGLKMEGSTTINFTNTNIATVVIVQSTWSDKTLKFDGSDLTATATGTGYREYKVENVAAGNHAITRGSGESGLFYISVTEISGSSPTVEHMTLSSTYALSTTTATPLSVDVTKVNDNDVLAYQWYVNSSNSTDGGTAITGANSSNYTPDISTVGILYYYCVIVEKDGDGNQVGNPAITNTAAIEVISSVEDPVFTEFNGTVQLDCATTAALVLYSLDNGATWIEYTKPFTVLDNDVTVKAKATVGGGALVSNIVTHDVVVVKKKAGSSSIVLYYNTENMTRGANAEGAENAALIGNDNTDYEGWGIEIVNALDGNKTISSGNSINDNLSVKGSNGRQVSIMMPAGVVANRITIYSYVNTTNPTSNKNFWSEVSGTEYSTNSIAMASWSDAANPDVRVYALDDKEDEVTITNNGVCQLCFYAVIDYTIVNGSVSLNSEGFATYSGEENVYISGAQAYTCVLNDDKTTIDAQPIASNVVPAYNGVLLYGAPNATVTLIYQSSADALGTNGLKPTTTANGLQPLEVALALNGNEFNLYTGSEFVPNKAYFPWSDSSQAKGITINFLDMIDEGDANAIDAATAEEETTTGVKKAVVNGQLVIKSANGIFNMAGARIK